MKGEDSDDDYRFGRFLQELELQQQTTQRVLNAKDNTNDIIK